jgi:prepilin-type N-terminal cleavage/methylation domain-containing protein
MYTTKKAFTLVELIVVIIILAILWTISFLSMQWYSKNARDSVRKSDIEIIIKSLDLHNTKTGLYPEPTNWTQVTYSWAEVWTQWVIWKSVIDVVDELTKIPLDPLTQLPYTYSRLNTKKEYEVATVLEWEISLNNDILSKNVYADWTQLWYAYVKWTYNWVVAKVTSW